MTTESSTMKAVVASAFGQPNDVLTVSTVPKPSPTEEELLIRAHAVSLSPSDYRTLLGQKTVVANPKMPYIPGGDVSGVVEHVPSHLSANYKVGDRVMSTWSMYGRGGLAQYSLIHPDRTIHLPDPLSFVEGAALANSAGHAVQVAKLADIRQGDRVLVLGGSGGVGSIILQLLKGASYVAATSTDEKLLTELGVNRAINYREENWWEIQEFQKDPFDVIIDCAEGRTAWNKCELVLKGKKDGGRFVAVVPQDWHINGRHWYEVIAFMAPPIGRQLVNFIRRKSPQYRLYMGEVNKKLMEEIVDMVSSQKFKVILDPRGPFPFTTEGVRDAWNLHIARGGHGKIVIEVD
jgi:NADPH:quinone reductase-like Zn-dependent oxidoreductase